MIIRGGYLLSFSFAWVLVFQAGVTRGDPADPFHFLESQTGVHQSQLVVQPDGSLMLVWVQRHADGLDLLVARQQVDGQFTDPVQVNRQAVNGYTGDETRPGVAVGPEGVVAIVWTSRNRDGRSVDPDR